MKVSCSKKQLEIYNLWKKENSEHFKILQRRGLLPEVKTLFGITTYTRPKWKDEPSLKIEKKINEMFQNRLKPILQGKKTANPYFGKLTFKLAPRKRMVIYVDLRQGGNNFTNYTIDSIAFELHTIRHEIREYFGREVLIDDIEFKADKPFWNTFNFVMEIFVQNKYLPYSIANRETNIWCHKSL